MAAAFRFAASRLTVVVEHSRRTFLLDTCQRGSSKEGFSAVAVRGPARGLFRRGTAVHCLYKRSAKSYVSGPKRGCKWGSTRWSGPDRTDGSRRRRSQILIGAPMAVDPPHCVDEVGRGHVVRITKRSGLILQTWPSGVVVHAAGRCGTPTTMRETPGDSRWTGMSMGDQLATDRSRVASHAP